MKTKIILGIAVLAVTGAWFGLAASHRHHQLVTLHVRNAPLAEVIRQLERQTKQKIEFDRKLDAKITLDVKNSPLTNVLDSVAEQAGARWGRTYAVYSTEHALRRLEAVLEGSSELDAAGWTNIAPRFDPSMFMPPPGFGSGPGKILLGPPAGANVAVSGKPHMLVDEDVRNVTPAQNSDGKVRIVTSTASGGGKIVRVGPGGTVVQNDSSEPNSDAHPRNVIVRRTAGPGGATTTIMDGDGRVKVTKTSADGTVLKEDEWSSARLVMEDQLAAKLGDQLPKKATPDSAAEAAKKVRGKFVTYYALDKPPIAAPGSQREFARSAARRVKGSDGTNQLDLTGDIGAQVEANAKQHRLDELSKSPEQQVMRAREKQQMKSEQ
jgi:hypothetical protein